MPRAAGDSHVYTWKLTGTRRGETYEIKFPSVTHVIKSVKDALGFGGMAWWGYQIGIAVEGEVDLYSDEWLEKYEDAKDTGITPNSIRDDAAERGTGSHDLAEALSLDTIEVYETDDGLFMEGNAELMAKILGFSGADKEEFIEENGVNPVPLQAHRASAASWWLDQDHEALPVVFAERVVWSVRYGFQGTLDAGRQVRERPPIEPLPLEVVDYKSHKPAAEGLHKDGSYKDGLGPAYIDDLIQLDGYDIAVEEMGLGTVVANRVVLFGADGVAREDTRTVPRGTFLDFKKIHDRICRKPECMLLARAYGGVM